MYAISGTSAARLNAAATDARSVAKLARKLRAVDKWPHVYRQGFSFKMPDGSTYEPSIATIDEGVTVCWEVAGTANAAKISRPDALPVVPRGQCVYFIVADDFGGGVWIEHQAAARAEVPPEFTAARGTLEKMLGRPVDDWDVFNWYHEATAAACRKSGRIAKRQTGAKR